MDISRPFILRPVATTLLMVALLIAGLLAYRLLPVAALPQVDYPTIRVLTLYPGASPDVMTSAVTAPLERQFGQMPGLSQMASTSSGGASVITLRFDRDLDLSVAEQEFQPPLNAANHLLPNDLPAPPVYNKVNPADTPIVTLAISSRTLPLPTLYDLVDTRMAQKLAQVSGVGMVSLAGGQRPAVRIQVDPDKLAAHNLTLADVRSLVTSENTNQPKGSFDGPTRVATLDANDQLRDPKAYGDLILNYADNGALRLGDVATIAQGAEIVRLAACANRSGAILVNVQRQPGANVIQTVDRIQALLPSLRESLPAGLDIAVLSDRTETIRAAVTDVQHEMLLAVGLVVMVTFVFLRRFSATLIPSVTVPLSLIGTFGAMYLAGFSLNNLSLMALTIATGFVVDDAIVMLENISRHLEEGATPMEAALKGARQIGFTLVSLTVSLIAVLIPLLFMQDVVGRLFREFAITLAVAILISLVISLTLTPMMCARLLKREEAAEHRLVWLERLIAGYGRALRWSLAHRALMLLLAVATFVLTAVLYLLVPKGFFPAQDTGSIQGITEAPQSISFRGMSERQQALAEVVLQDPAVASLSSYIGVDGDNVTLNSGRMQINLKPQSERDVTAQEVIDRLRPEVAKVVGITLYMQPVQDLSVEDRVSRTQYQLSLDSPDANLLDTWVPRLTQALQQRPEVTDVTSDLQNKGLQLYLTIDRDAAARLGVQVSAITDALYDALGQRQISTIYTQANQYRVVLASAAADSLGPDGQWQLVQRQQRHRDGHHQRNHHGHQSRAGAAVQPGENGATADPPGDQSPEPVPGGDSVVQPGQRRLPRRRGGGHRRGQTGDRPAGGHQHPLPGRGGGLPGLAVQYPAADPGGGGGDVHRPGGALRELHPSPDHPLDAALGGHRRAAGLAAHRQRPRPDRGDRYHPADRHRQEERHHDDRLRPRRRTAPGAEAGGGHLPGGAAEIPADPHDHAGGAVRRRAADAGHRRRRRVAPAAGPGDGRRPAGQSGADAVHHASHLPGLRQPGRAPGSAQDGLR